MRHLFISIAVFAVLASTSALAADDTQAVIQKALTEMNNPQPDGGTADYEKYLDPNCFYVQENDTISTKADMLKDNALPPKGIVGHIDVEILNFHQDGDIAVAVARDHETENYFGQTLHATYLYTTTWRKRADGWKMIAEQVLAEPIDPPAITLPVDALSQYAGKYTLKDSNVQYTVALESDALKGSRVGRPPIVLNAEATDVFFVTGQPRIQKIFQRDANGRIAGFVDRREGRDVVWIRE